MAILMLCLVTWLVIMVFAIVPKRFNFVEMVFLYFVGSILSVTIFAILVINLQWIPASRDVDKAIALDICRFIEIPLLLIISSDVLNSSLLARTRWLIAISICTLLVMNDWMLVSLGILVFRKWNYVFAFFDYVFFVSAMNLIARWFVHIKQGGGERFD